jgi:endonuclease YncB( thermonuclease family)
LLDAGKTQQKMRLAAIDAPELKQAFATPATADLKDLAG